MSDVPTVVLADDSKTVRSLVARILTRAGFNVVEVGDGLDALAVIALERPHLAVLDHEMPGCTGLEVVRRLKAQPATAGIPVIILTGANERSVAAEALQAGAADFVRKPCDPAELVARVRKVSEQRSLLDDLDRKSSTDPLTGLPNRRGMQPVFAALEGPAGEGTAIYLVDLDHFKRINDTLGHDAGDVVLRTVAGRLAGAASPFTAARWGGEEFVVAGKCGGLDELRVAGERLRQAIAMAPCQFEIDDELLSVQVTVSIGAVLVPEGADLEEGLAEADAALYAAKDAGRDRVVVVSPDGLEVMAHARTVVAAPDPVPTSDR